MGLRRIIIIYAVFLALVGCSTPQVVYVPTSEKEYVYAEKIDTTIIRDSIYITEKQQGDTIYINKVEYRDRYRYINCTDTLVKVDTIGVPYPVEKIVEVEKKSFIKDFFMYVGIIYLLVQILFLVLKKQPP